VYLQGYGRSFISSPAIAQRSIGPFRGGRVVAVAGDPTNPSTFYFGSTGGGVWKSIDGGRYWQNVSDGFFKWVSVGALRLILHRPLTENTHSRHMLSSRIAAAFSQ
jgi:hypothetical protein